MTATGLGHQLTEKVRKYDDAAGRLAMALAECDFDVKDDFEREMFRIIQEATVTLRQAALVMEDEFRDKA